MRLAELLANPPWPLRPWPFLVLALLSLAIAAPFTVAPFITSFAPPEPPLLAKAATSFIVGLYLHVVAIAVGVLVPFSRLKLTLAMVLASTWAWLLLLLVVIFDGDTIFLADFLALLPLPIAFALSFLGVTIGRGIRPRDSRRSPESSPQRGDGL